MKHMIHDGYDTLPFVSVILAVRNEERFIRRCLDCIFQQNYSHDRMELIIADGNSVDKTKEIIKGYLNRDISLILLANPREIVPTGLNLAISCAHGEVIIRIDGHTLIAPDYVSQCIRTLGRTQADNVGGRMNATSDTVFGRAVAIATSTSFGIGDSRFHFSNKEECVDSVYMGAWPRQIFKRIGLFDEELVRDQDDEFNYRITKNRGKIVLNPDIHSIYSVRSSPKTLWKQYFQYGYWKVRVLQKHPRQMSLRQFVPPAFVLTLILSAVLIFFIPFGKFLLALVAGSYLLASLCASVLTANQRGWKHLPLLPIVFAILHLSYGSGFLAGLVKFANRWGDRRGKVPPFETTNASD